MKKTQKLNIIMSDILTTKPEHLRGTSYCYPVYKYNINNRSHHLKPSPVGLDWLWRSGYGIQLLQSLQMFFGPVLPC